MEWISFEKFRKAQIIGKDTFGEVFSAIWSNGPNWRWDQESKQYFREGERQIALIRLFNFDKDVSALIQKVRILNIMYI